jgi:hypothetical protein
MTSIPQYYDPSLVLALFADSTAYAPLLKE